jgi:undecaprenyl-diphosphatase
MNLFEAKIVLWIQQNLRADALDPIVTAITSLGNAGIFWIILTVLLLIFKKTRKIGLCCALALIFDLLAVNIAIKPLVARVRPYVTLPEILPLGHLSQDFSFPSGHSAASLAAAWAIFRTTKRKFGVPAMILALLIALSRLYVGVHYPTDVICGAIIGAVLAEIAVRIVFSTARKIKERR